MDSLGRSERNFKFGHTFNCNKLYIFPLQLLLHKFQELPDLQIRITVLSLAAVAATLEVRGRKRVLD